MLKPFFAALSAICVFVPQTAFADGNWFVGGGLGQSRNIDYECPDCGAPIGSLDDNGFGFKVFGGYRFNPFVAVQGGYISLADTDATGTGGAWTDTLEVDGFYAAVQGIYPIDESFEVFATAGLFRWDQTVTFDGDSGSFDGTDPMIGLGASYAIGETGTKAQIEWNRFFDVGTDDEFFGHTDNYDLFTVNLILEF